MAKINYVCPDCGGDNIWFDATAVFNPDTQDMELGGVMDSCYCDDCDCTIEAKEIEYEPDTNETSNTD